MTSDHSRLITLYSPQVWWRSAKGLLKYGEVPLEVRRPWCDVGWGYFGGRRGLKHRPDTALPAKIWKNTFVSQKFRLTKTFFVGRLSSPFLKILVAGTRVVDFFDSEGLRAKIFDKNLQMMSKISSRHVKNLPNHVKKINRFRFCSINLSMQRHNWSRPTSNKTKT